MLFKILSRALVEYSGLSIRNP